MAVSTTLLIRQSRTLALAVLLPVAFACDGGTQTVDPAAPDTTDNGGGGGELRTDLTVVVTVQGEAAEAAAALGSPAGRLSGAQVVVQGRSTGGERDTAISDASGVASFDRLLSDAYDISLSRLLSSEEAEQVAAADESLDGIRAFGGGGILGVSGDSITAEIEAVAGRRGSLVFSEVYNGVKRTSTDVYHHAPYFELYNNADTTIYLDQKVIGLGTFPIWETSDPTCADMQQWLNDPAGIWSELHMQFPGNGQDYPLAAGETVIVAKDAVDHSEFYPELPDLSRAAFESIGHSDVDNPASANMIDVGTRTSSGALGHGWFIMWGVLYIADALDPDALVQEEYSTATREVTHRRIPAEKVLDVANIVFTPEGLAGFGGSGMDLCPEAVHPSFDRQSARLHDEDASVSIQRRVIATFPDGRPLLQRTMTSAVDYFRDTPSPTSVP